MHKLHWYHCATPLLKLYTETLHTQAGWKVLCPRPNHSQVGYLRGWVMLPVRFPPQPLQTPTQKHNFSAFPKPPLEEIFPGRQGVPIIDRETLRKVLITFDLADVLFG